MGGVLYLSSEIFSVCTVRTSSRPITYRLIDTKGNILEGWFYSQELSLVKIPKTKKPTVNKTQNVQQDVEQTWAIDQIVDRKKKNGIEYVYVKWKGFDDEHNSWIPTASIVDDSVQ